MYQKSLKHANSKSQLPTSYHKEAKILLDKQIDGVCLSKHDKDVELKDNFGVLNIKECQIKTKIQQLTAFIVNSTWYPMVKDSKSMVCGYYQYAYCLEGYLPDNRCKAGKSVPKRLEYLYAIWTIQPVKMLNVNLTFKQFDLYHINIYCSMEFVAVLDKSNRYNSKNPVYCGRRFPFTIFLSSKLHTIEYLPLRMTKSFFKIFYQRSDQLLGDLLPRFLIETVHMFTIVRPSSHPQVEAEQVGS